MKKSSEAVAPARIKTSQDAEKEKAVKLWKRRGEPSISEAVRAKCLQCKHCYWYVRDLERRVDQGHVPHGLKRWLRCDLKGSCPLQPFQNFTDPKAYVRGKKQGAPQLQDVPRVYRPRRAPRPPKRFIVEPPGWSAGLSTRTQRILVSVLRARTIDGVRALIEQGRLPQVRGCGRRTINEAIALVCDQTGLKYTRSRRGRVRFHE